MRAWCVALVGLLMLGGAAAAQERPYNPPVGSKWIIESETNAEEERAGKTQTSNIKNRAELTIDEKIAEGFRVTYVTRLLEVSGTAPAVELMGPAFSAIKDIPVRGTIDASGKPVRVDNLPEVRAAMQILVNRAMEPFETKPKVAEILRNLLTSMMLVEGDLAAKTYMESLPALAAGQNTGLQVGQERKVKESVATGLPNLTIRSTVTLKMLSADAQSGKVRLLRTSSIDPESMRGFVLDMVKQMGVAVDKPFPPEVTKIMETAKMTLDGRSEIDVEDGMTRALRDSDITTLSAMGHTFIKRERKTVTVTQAP